MSILAQTCGGVAKKSTPQNQITPNGSPPLVLGSRAITTASSRASLPALASEARRILKCIPPDSRPSSAILMREVSTLLEMSADPHSKLRTLIENSTTKVDSTVQQKHIRTIHQVFISVTERCLDCCREHRADDTISNTKKNATLRTVLDLFHRAQHLGLAFHRPLYQRLMVELAQHVAPDRFQPYAMIREMASSHPNETILCYRTAIVALLECGHYRHANNLLEVMVLVFKIPFDETNVNEIYRLVFRIAKDAFSLEDKEEGASAHVFMGEILQCLEYSVGFFLEKPTGDADAVQEHRENHRPHHDTDDDSNAESDDDEDYDSELIDDTDSLSGTSGRIIHLDDTDEASDDDEDDEYAGDAITLSKVEERLFQGVKSASVRAYFSMLTAGGKERHVTNEARRSLYEEEWEAHIENDIPDQKCWKFPDVTDQLEAHNEEGEILLTQTFADYFWEQAEYDEKFTRGVK